MYLCIDVTNYVRLNFTKAFQDCGCTALKLLLAGVIKINDNHYFSFIHFYDIYLYIVAIKLYYCYFLNCFDD